MPRGIYIHKLRGEAHGSWKGDKVGYSGIHMWFRDNIGKAFKCQWYLVGLVCSNKSKNFHWALLKGKKYERRRTNFIMLCASCHKKYDCTDETRKKISLLKTGQRSWLKGTTGLVKANSGSFKKGHIPWIKGRIMSQEHNNKIKEGINKSRLGRM